MFSRWTSCDCSCIHQAILLDVFDRARSIIERNLRRRRQVLSKEFLALGKTLRMGVNPLYILHFNPGVYYQVMNDPELRLSNHCYVLFHIEKIEVLKDCSAQSILNRNNPVSGFSRRDSIKYSLEFFARKYLLILIERPADYQFTESSPLPLECDDIIG